MSGSEPKLVVSLQTAFVITCKNLASRIFSNNLPIVCKSNGPIGRGHCWILPKFKDRNHSSLLPRLGKVMGAKN